MVAICYSGPILTAPTKGEKRSCGKFLMNISKTEGLVRAYTDREKEMTKMP